LKLFFKSERKRHSQTKRERERENLSPVDLSFRGDYNQNSSARRKII